VHSGGRALGTCGEDSPPARTPSAGVSVVSRGVPRVLCEGMQMSGQSRCAFFAHRAGEGTERPRSGGDALSSEGANQV